MRSNVIFQTMELHIILNMGVISNMPLHGRSHKECYLRQSGEFLPSANEDKHSREHIVWFFFSMQMHSASTVIQMQIKASASPPHKNRQLQVD